MPSLIQLSEALRRMERVDHKGTPTVFAVTVVQADRQNGTGGEIKRYENCILAKYAKQVPRALRGQPTKPKDPWHWENATRNLYLIDRNEIRKIHIRLILGYNDETVIY